MLKSSKFPSNTQNEQNNSQYCQHISQFTSNAQEPPYLNAEHFMLDNGTVAELSLILLDEISINYSWKRK